MNRPFVRLKDIAERTGFSINTVSVVLRGRSELPESTRARILEVARELNYVPNAVARSLVRQTTQTVGVVLTNIMNPILTRAAQAIERNLTALGYGTVFSISGYDLAKERAAIDRLLERQVDGILLYPANHDHLDHLEALRATGFPLVLLTRVRTGRFDVVSLDDRKGALLVARHLVHLGHQRIAMIDTGLGYGSREKSLGFRAGLVEAGVTLDPRLVVVLPGSSATDGYRAIPDLMSTRPRPTAVFAATDSLAIGVLRWCRENAVRVPQDLAITGFDDIETSAFLDVPLTTVSYPADEVGEKAVQRVVELIGLPLAKRACRAHVVEPRLVIRESSGRPGRRARSVGARKQ
jgi:LacI family transcriptional regulator